MKRFFLVLISLCSIVLLLSGCGDDGADGSVSIQLNHVDQPLSYWDNNPGIPNSFYYKTFYRCSPGTYNFEYTDWDEGEWSGTYTLTVNKGKKHSGFSDGDDGKDKFYTLNLFSIGPSISYTESAYKKELALVKKRGITSSSQDSECSKTILSGKFTLDQRVYHEIQHVGNSTMELKYQRVLR